MPLGGKTTLSPDLIDRLIAETNEMPPDGKKPQNVTN